MFLFNISVLLYLRRIKLKDTFAISIFVMSALWHFMKVIISVSLPTLQYFHPTQLDRGTTSDGLMPTHSWNIIHRYIKHEWRCYTLWHFESEIFVFTRHNAYLNLCNLISTGGKTIFSMATSTMNGGLFHPNIGYSTTLQYYPVQILVQHWPNTCGWKKIQE